MDVYEYQWIISRDENHVCQDQLFLCTIKEPLLFRITISKTSCMITCNKTKKIYYQDRFWRKPAGLRIDLLKVRKRHDQNEMKPLLGDDVWGQVTYYHSIGYIDVSKFLKLRCNFGISNCVDTNYLAIITSGGDTRKTITLVVITLE